MELGTCRKGNSMCYTTSLMPFLSPNMYSNMDMILAYAIVIFSNLLFLVISYDIACQWYVKLYQRMVHWPCRLRIPDTVQTRAVISKLHFHSHQDKNHAQHCLHWMLGVGQCDCECPEQIWAAHNSLRNSTKSQGPGTRHDNLNFHFSFWNWEKYSSIGE